MTPYYDHGGIQLFLGDCRVITEWTAAAALVTDPPYGIGWTNGGLGQKQAVKDGRYKHAGIAGDKDTGVRDEMMRLWAFGEDPAQAKPGLVFGSPLRAAPAGAKQALVWQKPVEAGFLGAVAGFRRDFELIFLTGRWPIYEHGTHRSGVLRTNAPMSTYRRDGRDRHPHAKPIPLLELLIQHTPAGAVIADPFAGSGSTLVAARNQGRSAIGVEVHEPYCEMIARSLDQGALFEGLGS